MSQQLGSQPSDELPPVRGWRIAFLVACTVGACLSADLLRLHVNVHTDPDYHSYCAMSEWVNCDTVALSDYSVCGRLPVALWGLLAYLAMGALAVWGLRTRLRHPAWPFGVLTVLSAIAAVLSVGLFALSHLVVKAICIVCGGTYLVSFALAFLAWTAVRRAGTTVAAALAADLRSVVSKPRSVIAFGGALALAVVISYLAVPQYWRIEISTGPGGLSVGRTAEGHPWIGAARPTLTIVEFSDYQCPHCNRGHQEVRSLIEQHPQKVRLVHRHFPLDLRCNPALRRPFHLQACRYAALARCAQEQDRFWEANDYLFTHGRRKEPVTLEELALAVNLDAGRLAGCVDSRETQRSIRDDLAAGTALRIRGTPTFVIGDRTYPGHIPSEVVRQALGPEAFDAPPPGSASDQSNPP